MLLSTAKILHSAEPDPPSQNPARLTELSLEQLGDIEVTSVSKQPETVWQTAVAIHVITQEDIRRSGATSLPELLRLAPGVEVARIDSDHWAVGVRGFGDQFSKSLLVLIDGRSIYTPLFAGMYWPAHDTLIQDIDRIEVIRGPGGTIWGANAVNGVINIITKPTAATHGALVSVGGGSLDRGSVAVRYGGGDEGFSYRAYAKGINRGPEFHADGADFDGWWTAGAGARADWTRTGGDEVTLQGEVSRGDHGQRVSISTFSPPGLQPLDGALEAWGANLLGRWQKELPTGKGFRLQAYYDGTSWDAPHFAERRDTFDVDFLAHLTLARRHRVTWGGGARRSPSVFTPVVPTLDFSPREHTDTIAGGFLQDEIMLVRDRVWLTLGAKVEHNGDTGAEGLPSARILWTPAPSHTFWSSVTRAVRTPSRIERDLQQTTFSAFTPTAIGPVPVFIRVTGNDDFAPERLLGYEAGYRTRLAHELYLDVAAFHNQHDRLGSFDIGTITVETSPPPLHVLAGVHYVNGVDGTSDGFEVSPDWQLNPTWQVKGSYSFVKVDLATNPASVDVNAVSRYEGSSPHHQARLQVHATLPHRAELTTAYRYVSRLPALKIADYHTADARVAWRPVSDLELFVSGENLLQPYHTEFAHTPGPFVGIARSVFAGFTWTSRNAAP